MSSLTERFFFNRLTECAIGGSFLFLSVYTMLKSLGKVAGISGILYQSFQKTQSWRHFFIAGLLSSGLLFRNRILPIVQFEPVSASQLVFFAISGLFVGIGTRIGSGCTSGHMLCGAARLSPRSLVASLIFTMTAMSVVAFNPVSGINALDSPIFIPKTFPITSLALLLGSLLLRKIVLSIKNINLTCFMCGSFFGTGLILSQMFHRKVVLGFLAFPSQWQYFDPALLMVVLFGLVPNAIAYFYHVKDLKKPELTDKFELPLSTRIDKKLVGGSILFGIGWGLSGICPGPALVGVTSMHPCMISFVASMMIGQHVAPE